jgi:hypothetical protein
MGDNGPPAVQLCREKKYWPGKPGLSARRIGFTPPMVCMEGGGQPAVPPRTEDQDWPVDIYENQAVVGRAPASCPSMDSLEFLPKEQTGLSRIALSHAMPKITNVLYYTVLRTVDFPNTLGQV